KKLGNNNCRQSGILIVVCQSAAGPKRNGLISILNAQKHTISIDARHENNPSRPSRKSKNFSLTRRRTTTVLAWNFRKTPPKPLKGFPLFLDEDSCDSDFVAALRHCFILSGHLRDSSIVIY